MACILVPLSIQLVIDLRETLWNQSKESKSAEKGDQRVYQEIDSLDGVEATDHGFGLSFDFETLDSIPQNEKNWLRDDEDENVVEVDAPYTLLICIILANWRTLFHVFARLAQVPDCEYLIWRLL